MNTLAYQVNTEKFQGPFHKLLELIEEQELNITELSLSRVTADFLEYIKTIEEVQPALLADFLVVASRLLLIKSKALLPELRLSAEEEEEIGDLEMRLKLYRAYKEASTHLEGLAHRGQRSYGRKYLQGLREGFFPADNVTTDTLWSAVHTVFAILQEYVMEQENISIDRIRLEDKITHIIEKLSKTMHLRFEDVSSQASRGELVVLFLAVLHLMRHGHAHAEQQELFGGIEIKKLKVDS